MEWINVGGEEMISDEMQTELQRSFSDISTHSHATKELGELKQKTGETLRLYIHRYSKMHHNVTGKTLTEQDDPTKIFHFLKSLQNTAITNNSARYDDFPQKLVECFEEALKLENEYKLSKSLNSTHPQDRGPNGMVIGEIHPHYEGPYNHVHPGVIHIEEIFNIDTDDISEI